VQDHRVYVEIIGVVVILYLRGRVIEVVRIRFKVFLVSYPLRRLL